MRTITYTTVAGRYQYAVTLDLLSVFRDAEGEQWVAVRRPGLEPAESPYLLSLTGLRRNSEVTITDDPCVIPAIRRRTQADLDAMSTDKLFALHRKLDYLADRALEAFHNRTGVDG
jgi:hypothetical protein